MSASGGVRWISIQFTLNVHGRAKSVRLKVECILIVIGCTKTRNDP